MNAVIGKDTRVSAKPVLDKILITLAVSAGSLTLLWMFSGAFYQHS